MKTLALGAAALGIWLTVGSQPNATSLSSSKATAEYSFDHLSNPELTDVVQQYCVRCHNEERLTGNLSLETFAVEVACLLYTSPSPRDYAASRMPSSA